MKTPFQKWGKDWNNPDDGLGPPISAPTPLREEAEPAPLGLTTEQLLDLAKRVRANDVSWHVPALFEQLLAEHSGFKKQAEEARRALSLEKQRAAGLEGRLSEAEAKLVPGSPTERAPTQWAYDQACAALETHRKRAVDFEPWALFFRDGKTIGDIQEKLGYAAAQPVLRAIGRVVREIREQGDELEQ